MLTRDAARGLLVADDKLLLMKMCQPWLPNGIAWLTPGGGIDDGEDHLTALKRELYEETGYSGSVDDAKCIWTRTFDFPRGGKKVRQTDHYYVLYVDEFQPTIDQNPEQGEIDYFLEFRWIGVQDIDEVPDIYENSLMGKHYRELLQNGPPSEVQDLGHFG